MRLPVQYRLDTAANWTTKNPLLKNGEPAIETDTRKEKLGDGVTLWNDLPYKTSSGGDMLQATWEPIINEKESTNNKGTVNGYTPLDAFGKVADTYLNIINNLTTGGATNILSAEQGKQLKIQIDAINTLLTSDNINLDTVQEIVDAIEAVQTSLGTILVNDLTTGGTTKALTSEMGKTLKGLIDALTTLTALNPSGFNKNLAPTDDTWQKIANKLDALVLGTGGSASLSINTIATTTYTFLLTDVEKQVVFTSATAVTATIPTNATTAIPIASRIKVTQQGDGVVTLVTTGLTVISASPLYLIKGQTITLIKTATDTWAIEGNNLNGEVRLPAYPSTRNDGSIPTNRSLLPDVNGYLKLYSMPTAPAPFIAELIPDSYLPSNTGNIELIGEFFIPAMCQTANLNNANGILLTGQTINYATFVNSQKIIMNVTTGAAEGSFSITCNNGLSTTKNNALSIVLGVVFTPIQSEWIDIVGSPIIGNKSNFEIATWGVAHSATWNKQFDFSKNIVIRCNLKISPYGSPYNLNITDYVFNFIKVSNGTKVLEFRQRDQSNWLELRTKTPTDVDTIIAFSSTDRLNLWNSLNVIEFKLIGGILYLYVNSILKRTYTYSMTENFYLRIENLKCWDFANIKYIELAT